MPKAKSSSVVASGLLVAQTERRLSPDFLPGASLAHLKDQCTRLISEIVDVYSDEVQVGEVGASGSAKASRSSPACPVGLLYGRVQSGKTNAMILLTAMAIENGFKTVVVLTSSVTALVEQTRIRFESCLVGPLVFSSDQSHRWNTDLQHALLNMPSNGMVIICGKNQERVGGLIPFLKGVGAAGVPALILDDEADQATPDTKQARRSREGASASQVPPSKIHGLTFGNDPQIISVRDTLKHNFFLQVTATPQALLLQPTDAAFKPKLKFLLEPGSGYVGGDFFFDRAVVAASNPPLVFLQPSELIRLSRGETPEGLKRAVIYYLLASVAMAPDPIGAPLPTAMLLHTSSQVAEHSRLLALLDRFIAALGAGSVGATLWQDAYAELRRTVPAAPPLADVKQAVLHHLPSRRISSVNYRTGSVTYGPTSNFIIGGNILGRGLTIKDLVVTYYLRTAGVAQMDTMHQHARMYGYRHGIRRFLRVFLTRHLAQRFLVIHESEEATRDLIKIGQTDPIPIVIDTGLRATRPGVLDSSSIGVIWGGRQVYPITPNHAAAGLAARTAAMDADLRGLLGSGYRQNAYLEVTIANLIKLIGLIPVSPNEPGSWNPSAIEATLLSFAQERGEDAAFIVVRHTLERAGPVLETGALYGPRLREARNKRVPVLFLFREDGDKARNWSGTPFWYPTVTFPDTMKARIYSEPPRPLA